MNKRQKDITGLLIIAAVIVSFLGMGAFGYYADRNCGISVDDSLRSAGL